jgi:hypothetical protein
LEIVYKIYGLFWCRIVDFLLCCGRFFQRKFKLIREFFEFVSQRMYNNFVVQLITIGKIVAGIALWSEGRRAGCTTWEKVGTAVADREASSAKTEVFDCKTKW